MRNVRALFVSLLSVGLSMAALACGSSENPGQTGSGGSAGTGGAGGVAGMGGSAGAGGMAGSSSSGGGSGGEGPCKVAADCPGVESECGIRTCNAGVCGMMPLKQEGAVLGSQLYGDCKRAVCDGLGNAIQVEDKTDRYDDGNPCTLDACQNSEPIHVNQDVGFACGNNNKCDGNGQCVRCLVGGNDCPAGTFCAETRVYESLISIDPVANRCTPNSCMNGIKDNLESDVDCGGGNTHCKPCAVGAACGGKIDCDSASCVAPDPMMPLVKVCQAPSCSDIILNGEETVVDMGGSMCPPVTNAGGACKVPTDCASGVCQAGKCVAPTCFDATKNGDEQGIDCGGSCAALCLMP